MNNVSARQFFGEGSGIVTLCGSSRFFKECMEANRALTFQNWAVLMCGNWEHSYHKDAEISDIDYASVKLLHYQKILESDAIVVVSDSTLYYGESTKTEIAFAEHRKKAVYFYNGRLLNGWQSVREIPNRYTDNSLIDSFFTLSKQGEK